MQQTLIRKVAGGNLVIGGVKRFIKMKDNITGIELCEECVYSDFDKWLETEIDTCGLCVQGSKKEGKYMSEGNRKVDLIMYKIREFIKNDVSSYNRVYEAFWKLVTELEASQSLLLDVQKDCGKEKTELEIVRNGLEESVKLQSHYAGILNQYDCGERIIFQDAQQWLNRLQTLKEEVHKNESD